MITFVWAEDQQHQIGIEGHLSWNLPLDLHHFKEITYGHPIIMGRKTFMSLPKVLPGRKHIVLTTSKELKRKYQNNENVVIVQSEAELQEWVEKHKNQNLCVIGGNSVFKALIKQADYLEKTAIKATFTADTTMIPIKYDEFSLIKKESHYPDEQNKYSFDFLTYKRKEQSNETNINI